MYRFAMLLCAIVMMFFSMAGVSQATPTADGYMTQHDCTATLAAQTYSTFIYYKNRYPVYGGYYPGWTMQSFTRWSSNPQYGSCTITHFWEGVTPDGYRCQFSGLYRDAYGAITAQPGSPTANWCSLW